MNGNSQTETPPSRGQRSSESINKALGIFKRLDRARRDVRYRGDRASIAMGCAGIGGFFALIIQLQISFGVPWLFEPISIEWRTGLNALGILLLFNAASTFSQTQRMFFPLRLLISSMPLANILFFDLSRQPAATHLAESMSATSLESSHPPTGFWKKPDRLKRFEVGILSAVVALGLIPVGFFLVGVIFAQQPKSTIQGSIATGLQIYFSLIMAFGCHRYETAESRGRLTIRRRLPLWPLALLPWGLGVLGLLALLKRPSGAPGSLAFGLFFDRTRAQRSNWLTAKEEIPRFRTSNLQSTGSSNQIDSLQRCQCVLLMFQSIALGVFLPFTPGNLPAAAMFALAACGATFFGYYLKSFKPSMNEPHPRLATLCIGNHLFSFGAAGLGVLIGCALGHSGTDLACFYLFIFGLFGAILAPLARAFSSGTRAAPNLDAAWIPVLWASIIFGAYGISLIDLRNLIENCLVWASITSWLLFLPIALLYQDLFIYPFTFRDLLSCKLAPESRRRLLPIALALVMPLGGLANAVLAVASLRRDRMLRLWWEARGAAEHRVRVRV